MIVSFWHLAAVTCVLLSATIAGCLMANGRTESEAAVGANLEDIVHRLAEQESPLYLSVLPPDESVIKNHLLAEPPAAVLEKAKQWMKRVIKDEWLPEDLADRLFAIKDWTRIERSAMGGTVRWSEVGDYVCASYALDDHQLMIQEDGVAVSLRVDLPKAKDAAVDVEAFITECIVRFLNVPAGYASQVHYDLKEDDGVYHGTALVEDENAEHWWWRRMRVLTDGQVFFVSALELDGTQPRPRAKIGFPDRF
jgi:hypothetical protein